MDLFEVVRLAPLGRTIAHILIRFPHSGLQFRQPEEVVACRVGLGETWRLVSEVNAAKGMTGCLDGHSLLAKLKKTPQFCPQKYTAIKETMNW